MYIQNLTITVCEKGYFSAAISDSNVTIKKNKNNSLIL